MTVKRNELRRIIEEKDKEALKFGIGLLRDSIDPQLPPPAYVSRLIILEQIQDYLLEECE